MSLFLVFEHIASSSSTFCGGSLPLCGHFRAQHSMDNVLESKLHISTRHALYVPCRPMAMGLHINCSPVNIPANQPFKKVNRRMI